MVLSIGITIRQMLTPDYLQAHISTTGRMIARGGSAVGAVLGGLLAAVMPIRAAFGVLAVSWAVGAGLVGWACIGTDVFAAIPVGRARR